MAKLKMLYDNEADIPEGFAELFTEKDGKWALTGVEGMPSNGNVERLESTLKKERKRADDAEKKLKAFEKLGDRDIDEVLEQLDEVEELRAKAETSGGDKVTEEAIAKRVETEVKRRTKSLERDLDKARTEAETFKKTSEEHATTIKRSKVRDEVTRAATQLKMRTDAIEDAVLIAERIFEVGDDGKPLTKDGDDPSTWLQEQKSKRAFWWPEAVGGGANGSGGQGGGSNGNNPFDKKSPNLTKAGQLMQSDPSKADQMARTAGHANAKAGIEAMARAAAGAR